MAVSNGENTILLYLNDSRLPDEERIGFCSELKSPSKQSKSLPHSLSTSFNIFELTLNFSSDPGV